MTEKPPLGVVPRWLHEEQRADALMGAMVRYYKAGIEYPVEWHHEYNELIVRIDRRAKREREEKDK